MRINRVHMAVRIRTMHSLLLFHVAHGTRIHRWSIGETNDAFSPGASATTFWPFVRRTDPRAECRRARAETEDLPNDHSGIRGDSRGRLRGWRDEKFRTDQQTAPTWLQERERKPIDGWNATGEKEGRDEERERENDRVAEEEVVESTTKEDGERKSDEEEWRRSLVVLSTRAPPWSTSAPKTPTLTAVPPWRAKGVVIRKREYAARVVTDYGIN